MSTWEQWMGARVKAQLAKRAEAEDERMKLEAGPMPSPECCTEWRREGNHWTGFITCDFFNCPHEHHGPKEERVLLAGAIQPALPAFADDFKHVIG